MSPAPRRDFGEDPHQQRYVDMVQRYWHGKGYTNVKVWAEQKMVKCKHHALGQLVFLEICSNLVNGLPPRGEKA